MDRSILTIHYDEKSDSFYICDNKKCSAGLSSVAYSDFHASEIGWTRMNLSAQESEAYGKNYLLLCPECAKNI